MKIAICDDDKVFLKNKAEYISDKTGYEITEFSSAKNLVEKIKNTQFDCVILDIDMPEINGFEAAQIIKTTRPETAVVFLTCHDNLVYESFRFRPFDFIRKSCFEKEICDVLSRLENELASSIPKKISLQTGNEIFTVNLSDIYYIESIRNKVFVYGKDGLILSCNKTLKSLEKELTDSFFRVHSGFIINMNYVFKVSHNDVFLSNEKTIPLSRSKANQFKTEFHRFMFKKAGEVNV